MTVKLLTEHHLEFLSLKEAAKARLSLHLSKCHIIENHMPLLNYNVGKSAVSLCLTYDHKVSGSRLRRGSALCP